MQKLLLVAISSMVLALVPFATDTVASASDNTFQGTWTSIDVDGSNQLLTIRGSGQGRLAMFLFDDSATTACHGSPAHLQGAGMVAGTHLHMRGTLTCMPGGNPLTGRVSLGFVYHSGSDTLMDDTGVRWHRS